MERDRWRDDWGVKRMANGAARKPSDTKRSAGAAGAARPSALLDTRVIYCGDCLDQLAKLPDGCVDLIYIDPPFNNNRNYEVFWGERSEPQAQARSLVHHGYPAQGRGLSVACHQTVCQPSRPPASAP